MDDRAHPETVTILVGRLVDQLRGRGLPAEPVGANMVWVASLALLCRTDRDGTLGWWWLRATGDYPEHEWICPAIEITMATDAIARALAPRPAFADDRTIR